MRQFGKGRVIAFGYRNQGLSWYMPMAARGHFVDPYFEYFYSLLCRSLIYAAGREPAASTDWEKTARTGASRTRSAAVEKSGKGPRPQVPGSQPRAGTSWSSRHRSDWNVTVIDVAQPDKVEQLKTSADVIGEGQTVTVSWQSTKPARIELIDGLGRVIARARGFRIGQLQGWAPADPLRVCAGDLRHGVEQSPVQFAASSREWNDYEVMLPWFGPKTYQPWIPAVDEQFRKIGITTLADPERNFKIMASAHLPGFGIYWYRRDAYLKRKADYARTKDTKYLVREVELQSPSFDAGLRAQLDKGLRPMRAA